MKRLMKIGVTVLPFLPFIGCVDVKVSQPSEEKMRQVSETTSIGQSEVSGIEPSVMREDGVVNVNVNLLGTFDLETRTIYASSVDRDNFIAVGFFPGVMSCRGEYSDCLRNGAQAFFYNLVFAGLPTVHGLLVEPCIPYYPRQTESIVGQTAFLKSPFIGFSRYSKPATPFEKQKVRHAKVNKLPLEDATISAPELGLESFRGQPLQIPVDKLSDGGDVKVKLSLPEEHPLKRAMSDFEDVEITIQCVTKQEE